MTLLRFVFIVAATLGVLSGCSGNHPPDERVRLTGERAAGAADLTVLEEVLRRFESAAYVALYASAAESEWVLTRAVGGIRWDEVTYSDDRVDGVTGFTYANGDTVDCLWAVQDSMVDATCSTGYAFGELDDFIRELTDGDADVVYDREVIGGQESICFGSTFGTETASVCLSTTGELTYLHLPGTMVSEPLELVMVGLLREAQPDALLLPFFAGVQSIQTAAWPRSVALRDVAVDDVLLPPIPRLVHTEPER